MKFFQIPIKTRFSHLLMALSLIFAGNVMAGETVDFSLPDIDGNPHKLSDYRGQWVVVNYWATWCPPCLTEIPELVNLQEDYREKGIIVLGVNFEDADSGILREFVEDYFMNYIVLREKPGPDSVMGDIPGLPTTFVVSPQGEILARQVGGVTAKMISDFIEEQEKQPVSNVFAVQ